MKYKSAISLLVLTGDPYEPDGEYYMEQWQGFTRYYSGAGSEEVDKSFVKFAIKHSKYTPLVLRSLSLSIYIYIYMYTYIYIYIYIYTL